MMNLSEVLEFLRHELGYKHHQLLDFVNDTSGEVIKGVSYVKGVSEALPIKDWRRLSVNVPHLDRLGNEVYY